MIIDSHCHLHFYKDEEKSALVKNAERAGIGILHNICTTIDEFPNILSDANKFYNVFASVGIHPCYVSNVSIEDSVSEEDLANPKVISIGETGLDFYRKTNPPLEKQVENFRAHIAIAKKTELPLVIHSRNADNAMSSLLYNELMDGKKFTGVFHCFTASQKLAEFALMHGFYISFSGILTFDSANELREIAKIVPKDKILIETDAPFLAPSPFRGQRNEPSLIIHTLDALAMLIGETSEKTAEITTENFFRLFSRAKSYRTVS